MNASFLFIENLRTSNIYNVNDIRTTQFSLNSLGSYVYNVLNSSTIQTIQSQFNNYANLNTSNLFNYLPQSNHLPELSNQFTPKGYVDNSITNHINNIYTSGHIWTEQNTFSELLFLNSIVNNSSTMNINSPRQIGYTYESVWTAPILINSTNQILETAIFDSPGVWQIHTQFEYSGEGLLTQINAGYTNGTSYKEDIIIALETNEVIQRFVPYVFINHSGTSNVTIYTNIQVNTGTIYARCKYFYVRIA